MLPVTHCIARVRALWAEEPDADCACMRVASGASKTAKTIQVAETGNEVTPFVGIFLAGDNNCCAAFHHKIVYRAFKPVFMKMQRPCRSPANARYKHAKPRYKHAKPRHGHATPCH